MPDDPYFSHPQQQTNKIHIVDSVGPFPEMNIFLLILTFYGNALQLYHISSILTINCT